MQKRMIAGYLSHSVYETLDTKRDYATLQKAIFFYVNNNGIITETETELELLNALCKKSIKFTRPYIPLEGYNNEIPSVLIENPNSKDKIIDVIEPGNTKNISTSEYDVCYINKGEEIPEIRDMLENPHHNKE